MVISYAMLFILASERSKEK